MNKLPNFSNNIAEVINLKKATLILLFSTALLAAVIILGVPQKQNTDRPLASVTSSISSNFTSIAPSSQENSGIITTASVGSENEDTVYLVKEYQGHIGVFRDQEPTPFEEIQIDVSIFPEIDQQLLKQGIKAYGPEELNRVIEDYEG
jgi:hypothetical protein